MNPDELIDKIVADAKALIDGNAIVACSGGIDSTVTAYLVYKSAGKKSLAVFVNTGMLRTGEEQRVRDMFEHIGINYSIVNCEEQFLNALKNVTDPEEKRKIIGGLFIKCFEDIATQFGATYLVQGTIAPDWIESGDSKRDRIKSHHNVGGLPANMKLKLYEPLRNLYKDEVRMLAERIGITNPYRQPFPGPGLAIRVIGEITREKLDIVRGCTDIVEKEVEKAVEDGKMKMPWQYFAVLLPIKSVGVQGDVRSYGYTVSIRIVESVDAMTASVAHVPYELLERISSRICSEYASHITRTLFDITSKPPATIEWE